MARVDSGWPDGLMRLLSITLPQPRTTPDGMPVPPVAAEIELRQTDTGEPITTVLDLRIDIQWGGRDGLMVATMTMCVGDDGLPLIGSRHHETYNDDGTLRTSVFRWVVAEMKVREPRA